MEELICPDLSKDDELNDLAVTAGLDNDPRRLGDLGVPRALPGVLVLDLGVKPGPKPELRFKVEFVETTAAESIIYKKKWTTFTDIILLQLKKNLNNNRLEIMITFLNIFYKCQED